MDLINKPGNKPFSLVPRMLQSMVYSYLLGAGVLSNFVQVFFSWRDSVAELCFVLSEILLLMLKHFIKKPRGLCTFQVLFTVSTHYCAGIGALFPGHAVQSQACIWGSIFAEDIFNSHVCSCVYIACQIAISVYCLLYLLL